MDLCAAFELDGKPGEARQTSSSFVLVKKPNFAVNGSVRYSLEGQKTTKTSTSISLANRLDHYLFWNTEHNDQLAYQARLRARDEGFEPRPLVRYFAGPAAADFQKCRFCLSEKHVAHFCSSMQFSSSGTRSLFDAKLAPEDFESALCLCCRLKGHPNCRFLFQDPDMLFELGLLEAHLGRGLPMPPGAVAALLGRLDCSPARPSLHFDLSSPKK